MLVECSNYQHLFPSAGICYGPICRHIFLLWLVSALLSDPRWTRRPCLSVKRPVSRREHLSGLLQDLGGHLGMGAAQARSRRRGSDGGVIDAPARREGTGDES